MPDPRRPGRQQHAQLLGVLDRVREERSNIRLAYVDPAGMAAPERLPDQFARALISFISDTKEKPMINRRYEFVARKLVTTFSVPTGSSESRAPAKCW